MVTPTFVSHCAAFMLKVLSGLKLHITCGYVHTDSVMSLAYIRNMLHKLYGRLLSNVTFFPFLFNSLQITKSAGMAYFPDCNWHLYSGSWYSGYHHHLHCGCSP